MWQIILKQRNNNRDYLDKDQDSGSGTKEYEHGQEPKTMNNRDQAKQLTSQFMNKDEDKM